MQQSHLNNFILTPQHINIKKYRINNYSLQIKYSIKILFFENIFEKKLKNFEILAKNIRKIKKECIK